MATTYATVFDNIVADLDSFFLNGYSSSITTDFKDRRNFVAKAKGSGKERVLAVSEFNANTEIVDVKSLVAAHLIAGHELAHLLNDHNLPQHKSEADNRALEMWADYYGSRLAYTILIFGRHSGDLLKSFAGPYINADSVPFEAWSRLLLDGTRDALDMFYNLWKGTQKSRVHPAGTFRVHSILGGVLSFFSRYYRRIEEPTFLMTIQALLLNQPWYESASAEMMSDEVDHEQFMHIGTMHERIQAERPGITEGLHPFFDNLIGTSYDVSRDALKSRSEKIAKDFDGWNSHFGKNAAAFARSF